MIELLAARGLSLAWARYVGDDRARITADLRDAFAGGDAVFSCGGIGATPDDHTRQCAAAALGVPLALHPRRASSILERMRDVAREQGKPYEPDRDDNLHRLNMGVFPEGAADHPEPVQQDRRLLGATGEGGVHFVPGFPVMALADDRVGARHRLRRPACDRPARSERSVIVFGAMEATLTPLMEAIEAGFPGVKVFSLPSVDHPEWGRHIELGVKGDAARLDAAYLALLDGPAGARRQARPRDWCA